MDGKDVLKRGLSLKPDEKFIVIEGLLKSLRKPNKKIEKIWAEEAEKRLEAYRRGKLKGIPMEEVFKNG